jgi:hypothetical protein
VKKGKFPLFIALIVFTVSVSNAGDIIFVDVDSPNDPGTGSFIDPFRRVQDALDAVIEGDTVEILPGLYTGIGNYNLDPNGKSITIRSSEPNNADIVESTIIDPNFAGRGFYFQSGEDANCIVLGLTIRNAYFNGDGGAIGCFGSGPTIKNCVISNNHSRFGGGVGIINGGSPNLINCTIVGNESYFDCGGVYCFLDGHVDIKNCIIWRNIDYDDDPNVYQVYIGANSSASIAYSDIQNGQDGVLVVVGALSWLSGNIDMYPQFAVFDPNGDPNIWDFHLKSIYGRWDSTIHREADLVRDGFIDLLDFYFFAAFWRQEGNTIPVDFDDSRVIDFADLIFISGSYLTSYSLADQVFDEVTSPCIDAGDPNSDWSNEPWPNGKRINMGAYGGTNKASMNGNVADFNIDGAVNFVDFTALADKWMTDSSCIEDLSTNGVVDFADLCIFAENWLWQYE